VPLQPLPAGGQPLQQPPPVVDAAGKVPFNTVDLLAELAQVVAEIADLARQVLGFQVIDGAFHTVDGLLQLVQVVAQPRSLRRMSSVS
jgi:hypothetical protein